MESLNDFSFLIYDLDNHVSEKFVPESDEKLLIRLDDTPRSELAVETLYTEMFGCRVANLDSRHKNTLKHAFGLCQHYVDNTFSSPSLPMEALEFLREDLVKNLDLSEADDPLDILNRNGIPDLLAYNQDENQYMFIEAKWPNENLLSSQIEWCSMFDFLPIKVVYAFRNVSDINKQTQRLEDKLCRKLG
jgi:hypothetical protein